MFKKIAITLILAGSLIIGHTSFSGSLTQAAANCGHSSTVLAENPELSAACRYHSVVSNYEPELVRIIEVGVTPRYTDLTDSVFLSANPELAVTWRYALVPD